MKLTKYQHACFTVEEDDKILVVDPGEFSTDFLSPENVVGIVITHQHGDHFDTERLAEIMEKNPEATIFAPASVGTQLEAFGHTTVAAGETVSVGPFELAFHGGIHAVIHESVPVVDNVGVLINQLVYYPGDSLVLPGQAIDTLLVPASAPWLKISEAMNFLAAVKPRLAIPTHDAILSTEGKEVYDWWLKKACDENNTEFLRPENQISI